MPKKTAGRGAGTAAPAKGRGRGEQDDRTPFRNIVEGQRFFANVADIAPNPRNPREEWEWEGEEFADFVANIEQLSQLQDPSVMSRKAFAAAYPKDAATLPEGTLWVLAMGEARWRAARELKQEQIPVVLCDANARQMDEVLWSENQSRRGLNPIQEGILFRRFRDEQELSLQEIAERLGKSANRELSLSDISKKIKLSELPDGPVRRAVSRRDLGVEPAYLLMTKLKSAKRITEGYALMQEHGLTAAKAVAQLAPAPKKKQLPTPPPADGGPPPFSSTKTEAKTAPSTAPDIPQQPTAGEAAPEAAFSSTKTQPGFTPRVEALRTVLASRTYGQAPDAVTMRLADALLAAADEETLRLGKTLADIDVTEDLPDREWVVVADAVALAADELRYCAHLNTGHCDAHDAAHLGRLIEHADYTPTAHETALTASVA